MPVPGSSGERARRRVGVITGYYVAPMIRESRIPVKRTGNLRTSVQRGFEPRMSFLECRSKGAGNLSLLFTYEIPSQKIETEQNQRNAPVWAIVGQYTSGIPVFHFKSGKC